MTAIASGLTIVCEVLEASGSATFTLTAGRIGRGRMPPGWKNTQSAIRVVMADQVSETDPPIQKGRYTLMCYGGGTDKDSADPRDAENVYEAAYEDLHNKSPINKATGGIVYSEQETVTSSTDPDSGFPVYIATFRIATQ